MSTVLSLIFAIRQATIYITDHRDRQRRITERLATAELQRSARDYRAAWGTLREAATIDPRADTVQRAREALAMDWLDHAATSQGLTLGALGDTVSPMLTRGTLDAPAARRADLLAHLGWADFLRWRDGQRQLDPSARYRQAIEADSLNPYAHAMLGHWLLWQRDGRPDEARTHFAAALRSGREGAYVRRMELAAFANLRSTKGDAELLRVANAMRVANDSIEESNRSYLWRAYSDRLHPGAGAAPSADPLAVAPGDMLLTYRWLFADYHADSDPLAYTYLLARLEEAAGDSAAAVSSYRAARTRMMRGEERFRRAIDSALTRLSR
jgi:Tfp pilus assembly protein PilF